MFQKIKNFFRKCNENIIPLIIILPIFEILIIECLHRRSVKAGFLFIIEEPFAFFINVALLMSMLSVCLLFRERLFWAFLFSLLWLILGIANCVILGNRVSPLSFNDVKVFSSVASIIRQYMGIPQIAIAIVFLGFCTVVTVYLRKRIPRIDRRKHLLRDMLLCFAVFFPSMRESDSLNIPVILLLPIYMTVLYIVLQTVLLIPESRSQSGTPNSEFLQFGIL